MSLVIPTLLTPFEPVAKPSARLRWLAFGAGVLLWLLVAAWAVFGVTWLVIHGAIVPRIGELRPQLEAQATRALGVPVRIGFISATSSGLVPSFELRDVLLLDAQARVAVSAPLVVATLSPRSLLRLGFEQLVIEQPALDVRRTADGRVYVGGLDVSAGTYTDGSHSRAADWLFSQTEVVLRGGHLRWTDELRAAPALAEPLQLERVDLLLRNRGGRHAMRLDATPPPEWGERFSLRGRFTQPLLSTAQGDFASWSGQLFAEFGRADVSRLRHYIKLDALGTVSIDLQSGNGAVRGWADVRRGRVTGATADVLLNNLDMRLGPALQPLAFSSVAGRVGGVQRPDGFELSTTALRFTLQDGPSWPGGNVALTHKDAHGSTLAQTALKADRLDLAALAQIASRLPLAPAFHTKIASFDPSGVVQALQAQWQGPLEAPLTYTAKGRIEALRLAALPAVTLPVAASSAAAAPPAPAAIGRPGLAGANIDFDLNQSGGRATVRVVAGSLELPGVLEDPRVALDSMSAEALWTHSGAQRQLQLRDLQFANADAQGRGQLTWRSADARGRAPSSSTIDLQGSLSRANGAQVHRYLPLVLPATARHYVRDAVLQGQLSDVKFKVVGPVQSIPFVDAAAGDFRISAKVHNGYFAYVPPRLQSAGQKPWPALTALNAELLFNRAAIDIKGATGGVQNLPGLQLVKGDARIPEVTKSATVEVSLALKGPLGEALRFVNTSALADMTGQALAGATGTGPAEYRAKLSLPVLAMQNARVDGAVVLPGNDLRFIAAAPTLGQLKGTVAFSERGFFVADARAKLLGGDVRIDGGMRAGPRPGAGAGDAPANAAFKAQGTLTADGLRQADLGLSGALAHLAQSTFGAAAYSATLGFKRGAVEFSLASSLQGLGLSLPAPFAKTADSVLPLRVDKTLLPESTAPGQKLQDRLSLSLGAAPGAANGVGGVARTAAPASAAVGGVLGLTYVRELTGDQPRVLRGALAVGPGSQTLSLPESGVAANVNLPVVDLDAWGKILDDSPTGTVASTASAAPAAGRTNLTVQAYLPTTLAIRANELVLQGHRLHRVVVGGTREGSVWRANLDATELNGYLEFYQPGRASANSPTGGPSGRLYARLSRLNLAASAASDVEAVLSEQPASIPALDIVVEDVELRGRKLGRVEIDAVNRSAATSGSGVREWRLNKFNVILPEARLTATGSWAALNARADTNLATGAAHPVADRRRSAMNFTLDIADSGELLRRFGMADVIRRGKGKLQGQVAWIGSPLSLDYPTLAGQFNVSLESGQFIKAEPGLAKLLGVLSLQSLPRRLTLDFRDVFSEGFAFDFVRGDVTIEHGLAQTNNLQMKGVNAAVLMEGRADLAHETQNIHVVVVPEINAGTASLIATVINPVIGLGTFLAQAFLRRPLMQAATQEFDIDGTWAEPRVTKVDKSARADDQATPKAPATP